MDKETVERIREIILKCEREHTAQRLRQRAQKKAHRMPLEGPISGQDGLRDAPNPND